MKYCCELFKELTENAGNPGIAAIARTLGDQSGFFLQSRVCSFVDEIQYRLAVVSAAKTTPFPHPIRLTTLQGIKYCPYCGNDLLEVINAAKSDFKFLAEIHAKFLTAAVAESP